MRPLWDGESQRHDQKRQWRPCGRVQGLRTAQLVTTPGTGRTNKGRREKRARAMDNDLKETLGRQEEEDGESLQSCKATASATMPLLRRKRGRKSMTRYPPRRVRRECSQC